MLCNRTMPSILHQTLQPDAVIVVTDNDREGAGPTRTRGKNMVETEWTAFVDDDDELLPQHLAVLCNAALDTGADVIFPWYEMGDGHSHDPLPDHFFGRQWIPEEPHTFPITALVRTEWAQKTDFPAPQSANFGGEDWLFWLSLSEMGAKFHHVAERTWRWWHHFTNTSGAPGRW